MTLCKFQPSNKIVNFCSSCFIGKSHKLGIPLTMAKHIKEELESYVEGGPKLLSSWAINEFLLH